MMGTTFHIFNLYLKILHEGIPVYRCGRDCHNCKTFSMNPALSRTVPVLKITNVNSTNSTKVFSSRVSLKPSSLAIQFVNNFQ